MVERRFCGDPAGPRFGVDGVGLEDSVAGRHTPVEQWVQERVAQSRQFTAPVGPCRPVANVDVAQPDVHLGAARGIEPPAIRCEEPLADPLHRATSVPGSATRVSLAKQAETHAAAMSPHPKCAVSSYTIGAEMLRFRPCLFALGFFLLAENASATWSVVAVDRATGLVVISSATCVAQQSFERFPAKDLRDVQAIVVPGKGVAAAQAAVDRTRENQKLI